MATSGWGWGGGGNDDEQDEGLTSTLVYGSGKNEGNEAQPAAAPESLPGPQPSAGDFSTGEGYSGNGMVRGSNSQPTPPTYNPSPLPTPPDHHDDQFQKFEQTLQKPVPSKSDPRYKPGVGDEIRGRLAAGLLAFGQNPHALEVGSNVINRKFDRATQDYQNQQATARQGMSDLRAQRQDENQALEQQMQVHNAGAQDFNSSERAYQGQVMAKDRAAQEQQRLQGIAPRSESPDDPNNKLMGGWHATTIGGQQLKLNGPPDSWLNSSEGKIAVETARRQGLVRDNKLKGDEAKYVMVNGKLKEPAPTTNVHIPSAEAEKYHDMKSAFHKENGRDPNLSELQSIMQGEHARGSMKKADYDTIIKNRDTGFQKAQAAYNKVANSKTSTPDEIQEAESDYLDAAETVQKGYEDRIRSKTGNDIEPFDIRGALSQSLHGKGGSAAAPQQAQPQAQPQAQAAPQQAPQAKRFNPAKWQTANPKGDVKAAIQAAQAQGYTIVGQ